VAVLDDGRVIARGDVAELVAAHAVPVLELSFHGDPPPLALPDAVVVDSRRVRIPAPDPAATLVAVLPDLPPGLLESVEIVRPDLESVYLALTGRRYAEADAAGLRDEEARADVGAG
jgi:ABC-2 type transport system ATP-binding protein